MTARRGFLPLTIAAAGALCAFAAKGQAAPPPSPSPAATATAAPANRAAKLGDVFVTAQRTNTGQLGTPRETYVIDAATFARLGALTIGDALAMLPGIVVRDYGADGHLQSVLLRGATSTETLVLLDGRPVNEAGVGDFDFSSIPVSAVERIEVVEGAASTLYGSAAMGGVINVITRSPSNAPRGNASVAVGYEGAVQSSAGFSVRPSPDSGASADLSIVHARDEYSYPAFAGMQAGTLPNDDVNSEDAYVALTQRFGNVGTAVHLLDDASSDGEPGDVAFGASRLARQQRYLLRSDVELEDASPHDDVVLEAYSDGQRLHFYDGTPGAAYDTLAHFTTRGFGVRDTINAGDDTLTGGYDSRGDLAQFDQVFYPSPPSSSPGSDATTAWYVSDVIRPPSSLSWTVGIRAERPQDFSATDVPSLGVIWKDAGGWSGFRANYDRAFRIPALEETSPFFFGNPKLEPEYAATFDVGYFNDGDSLTYFGTRASNLIVSEPPDFVPENVSLASIRGVNVNLRASLGDQTVQLAYTDYLSAVDLTNGQRLPFRPTATSALQIWRQAARATSYGVSLSYVGHRFADDPNTQLLPAYASIGAFASRRIGPGTDLTLRLSDLTGERVEEVPGFPVPGPSVSLSIATAWPR
jgi:vitamin B12 transporter